MVILALHAFFLFIRLIVMKKINICIHYVEKPFHSAKKEFLASKLKNKTHIFGQSKKFQNN